MSDKSNKSKKCNYHTNLLIEEQKNDAKQSSIKGISIEIQNEIKNIVISKFIDQIQILVKELELYKKENRVIKNDLTYVLKRILNNQIDYNPLANFNHSQFNNSINNNSSVYFNKSNRSFLSSEKLNTVNNFNKSKVSSNKSINEETLNSSPYNFNKNKCNSIDIKINNYLNSLYKHNFVDNNILGAQGNYRLNNSTVIYDELFKKNAFKHNHSQKNIKSTERNTINEDEENEKLNKNMNIQTCVDSKVLKVKRNKKKNSINLKNKNTNSNYQKYGVVSSGTTTLNSNDKKYNESNRVFNKKRSVGSKRIMCTNRSPFLANKF